MFSHTHPASSFAGEMHTAFSYFQDRSAILGCKLGVGFRWGMYDPRSVAERGVHPPAKARAEMTSNAKNNKGRHSCLPKIS